MSKICGIASPRLAPDVLKMNVRTMTHLMKHHAEHRVDQWSHKKIGYGHISIGAVNEEPQPLFSNNGTTSVVFAGKVFGYENARRNLQDSGHRFQFPDNDAEFVLHLYDQYGVGKFNELNGIFAFSIWDETKNELILVNDRYGMRPIYYHYDSGKNIFLFSSELKSIARLALYDKQVNWEAWNVFLRLGFLVDDDTFFKNIYFLPPASILRFDLKTVVIDTYWDCTTIQHKNTFDEKEDIDTLGELFRQSIQRRILPDKKTAVFLSGGPDSSGIAAELKKQNMDFVSYTTRKFCRYDADQQGAEFVAGLLGVENIFCDLPENFLDICEPRKNDLLDYQCAEHAWLLPLLDTLPTDTKINFDGLGFDFMCDTCMYDDSCSPVRKLLETRQYEKFIKTWYCSSKAYHLLLWPFHSNKTGFIFLSKSIRKHLSDDAFIEKVKKQLVRVENTGAPYVFFHLLTRARRCVAASIFGLILNQVESFCPYLDNDFFDYLMRLPLSARRNSSLRTKILGRIHPELFSPDSCLWPDNAKHFNKFHGSFYPQKVRHLSKTSMGFLRSFRADVFNPLYLVPRIGKDLLVSKLYSWAGNETEKKNYYNRLHFDLIPPLDMLNQWLIKEKIPAHGA